VLTPLEKALLEGELGGQSRWRAGYLVAEDSGEDGSIMLTLSEDVGEGFAGVHRVRCYLGRFPLRAGTVGGAVVRQHRGPDTLSLILFEVNRALVDGGALVLSAEVDNPERLLVKHGFALISEHRPGGGGFSVTFSRKAWRKYLGDACPRCGSTHILPLIPPDANVRKIWTLYCSSCSYNWSVEEPITEWI
jgi:hypothetical protein